MQKPQKYAKLNLVPYRVGNIVEYRILAVFYYIWYG